MLGPRQVWIRTRVRTRSGLGQSILVGEDDGLDPVAQVQLGQGVGDVRLDRGLAEEEFLGDLAVGQAARHEREDLAFAVGEARQGLLLASRARGRRS